MASQHSTAMDLLPHPHNSAHSSADTRLSLSDQHRHRDSTDEQATRPRPHHRHALHRARSHDAAALRAAHQAQTLTALHRTWTETSYRLSREALHTRITRGDREVRAFVDAAQAYDQALHDLLLLFLLPLPPLPLSLSSSADSRCSFDDERQRRFNLAHYHHRYHYAHTEEEEEEKRLIIASLRCALEIVASASFRIRTYALLGRESARCAPASGGVLGGARDAEAAWRRFRLRFVEGTVAALTVSLARETRNLLSVSATWREEAAALGYGSGSRGGGGTEDGGDGAGGDGDGDGNGEGIKGWDHSNKHTRGTNTPATKGSKDWDKLSGALQQDDKSRRLWRTSTWTPETLSLYLEGTNMHVGSGYPLLPLLAYQGFKFVDRLRPAYTEKAAQWMLNRVLVSTSEEKSSGLSLLRHKVKTRASMYT